MAKLNILCLIPARGGSKGIPQKNLVRVSGKPLLGYTIEQALATPDIDRIVVSTDDPDIAQVARDYGTEVIWRPAEISGDSAPSEAALIHALDHLQASEDYMPDLVVFLQATSPLRRKYDIQKAIEVLIKEDADSLFSGSPVQGFVWRMGEGGILPINYDPAKRPMRQEVDELIMEENGSIYVFKPWVLRKYQSRLGGKITVYPMQRSDSFQVDDIEDLDTIEMLIKSQYGRGNRSICQEVELLVLDFDGVLTDNRVLVQQDGMESVLCNRGDSLGIAMVKEAGLNVIVLSTETNPVVSVRCRKLGIDCFQGKEDKLHALELIAFEHSIKPENIAYVGNDLNDLSCMRWVGVPIAVADAHSEVKKVARHITQNLGGHGAVREVAELILS